LALSYDTGWTPILATFVSLQAIVIVLQEWLGASFFLPRRVSSIMLALCQANASNSSMPNQTDMITTNPYPFPIQNLQTRAWVIALSAWTRYFWELHHGILIPQMRKGGGITPVLDLAAQQNVMKALEARVPARF
jgi:hypothetical protein